ncbi:MAG: hypothetical protein L6R35_006206 [Caloplaca aegaea]|nr:MAG: hypothetical protein L6R35_006206 [Caloplaca aegaea]
MNSLNLLSSRVVGQTPPEKPGNYRRRSFSEGNLGKHNGNSSSRRSVSQHVKRESSTETLDKKKTAERGPDAQRDARNVKPPTDPEVDGSTLLINHLMPEGQPDAEMNRLHTATRRLVKAVVGSTQCVLSTLVTPMIYIISFFHDEQGLFSPLLPLRRLARVMSGRGNRQSTAQAVGLSASPRLAEILTLPATRTSRSRRSTDSKSKVSSAPKSDSGTQDAQDAQKYVHSSIEDKIRTKLSSSSDESSPVRRSIRIRLYSEDTARKRKPKRTQHRASSSDTSTPVKNQAPPLTVTTLKSPTSPASSLRMTKYPRAPAPPRPLILPRQSSFSSKGSSRSSSFRLAKKTLVIDLDETLIHSLAKGGRMSSGHMVEVKLNTTVGYGSTTLRPQHPILYYVHKRPHCDEFLRKVCNWYELVVFTASVQEYADPVIDWLEQERKYFTRRYYRQHCTFRNGAYIKDLSTVEPDLSMVMIIDNSPLSYIFHEDNAIPIEGWINDPTDNDLLHLIPILEALQHVMDVRALLALRGGQIEAPH